MLEPTVESTEISPLINKQPENSNLEEISAVIIIFDVIKTAVTMALSFTFSWSQILIALFISWLAWLGAANADDYLATAFLVTTMTNVLISISFSPFFSTLIRTSKMQGKLSKIRENTEDLQNIQDIQDISKINTIKKVTDIFKSGIILSTLIAPAPFFGLYFSRYILTEFFHQDAHIADMAQQFLRVYAFAILWLLYRICAEQIMFSFGKTLPAMLIGLGSLSIGTGLSYILTFIKKFGLEGIAYGYVAEAVLTCIGFWLYLGHHPVFKDMSFFNFLQIDRQIFKQAKKLLKIGLPMTLQITCELMTTLLIGFYSSRFGKSALAAQNFASQLFILAIILSISFGQTVTQKVSSFIGQKDYKNAMRYSRYGLFTTVGCIAAISIPPAVAPEAFTAIFSHSVGRSAMNMAKSLLPLAATQAVYDAANYTMIQVSRATDNFYVPTLIKISCLWLGVLASYYLGFHTSLGIYGVGIGFMLGVAFAAMILFPPFLLATTEENLEITHTKMPEEKGFSIKTLYQKYCPCFFTPAEENHDNNFIEKNIFIPEDSSPNTTLITLPTTDAMI